LVFLIIVVLIFDQGGYFSNTIFMHCKIDISNGTMQAHLCGLQERVEQTTRELESSVREPAGSSGSSRSSSPLLYNGVSYEDIGGGGSGLEMEEVS
jgi:hypothetical protein